MSFFENGSLVAVRDMMVKVRALHANGSAAEMRIALEGFVQWQHRFGKLYYCKLEVRGSDDKDFILAKIAEAAEADMRRRLEAATHELKAVATNVKMGVRLEELVDTESPKEALAVAAIERSLKKPYTLGSAVVQTAKDVAELLNAVVEAGFAVTDDERAILALYEPYVPVSPSYHPFSDDDDGPVKRARV